MRYRFDEIAVNSTAKKKPVASDKDTYLGLEHLDSGNLTVTRFGSEVAPIGEKLIMRKGDVLFGKRRAYQKKVAIAPFDGIFSAHGMVLRPNEKIVDKGFFPLFISSDYFLDDAIKISVGSLSPTINWNALKEVEFNLPTIGEQRKLAELLWAAYSLREAYKRLLLATDELVKSQFVEMFGIGGDSSKWPVKHLGDICELKAGKLISAADIKEKYADGLFPCYGGNGLRGYVGKYSHDGSYPLIGRQGALCGNVQYVRDKFYATEHAVITRPKVNIDTLWLCFLLKKKDLNKLATGAAQPGLTVEKLNYVEIPLPPLSLQTRFSDFVRQADKLKFELQRTLDELEATYKAILREKLG